MFLDSYMVLAVYLWIAGIYLVLGHPTQVAVAIICGFVVTGVYVWMACRKKPDSS